MKVVGCQSYAPAAFTPMIILVLILEAESTPGHMELSHITGKTPATPGIDPGTFRLVAHYATPDPWGMFWLSQISCRSAILVLIEKTDGSPNDQTADVAN